MCACVCAVCICAGCRIVLEKDREGLADIYNYARALRTCVPHCDYKGLPDEFQIGERVPLLIIEERGSTMRIL